jgi:hypothetical protein
MARSHRSHAVLYMTFFYFRLVLLILIVILIVRRNHALRKHATPRYVVRAFPNPITHS